MSESKHRAIIYGAGRIGMCLGGCLLSSGWTVLFVGRKRLIDEIKEHDNKVKISDFRGSEMSLDYDNEKFLFCEKLSSDDVKEGDYILITVKRAASEEVAEELKALDLPKVNIISFQNGVGNKDIYEKNLPKQNVLTAIFGANVIKYDDEPHFRLATTNPALIEKNDVSDILYKGLIYGQEHETPYIDCEIRDDMQSIMYGKLLLNLNNAVNALVGKTLYDELAARPCRLVLSGCMEEGIAAMKANNIHPGALSSLMQPWIITKILKLPTFLYLITARSSLQVDEDAKSSMWDDLSSGRETEIDYLNGIIIHLGKKANFPTPLNQKVYDLIKKAEANGKSPRYSPEELYTLVFEC